MQCQGLTLGWSRAKQIFKPVLSKTWLHLSQPTLLLETSKLLTRCYVKTMLMQLFSRVKILSFKLAYYTMYPQYFAHRVQFPIIRKTHII